MNTSARQPIPPRAVEALLLDTTPFLSCEECFERLDTHVEALLAGSDTDPAMSRHLDGCAACADEAAALRQLVEEDTQGA
ncbi:hypothetical protein SAMN05216199_2462 [Pedococcus cremeus]|uniref:Zinc-finger domain-containing protein n=1 Tax=Pedococcus cremeus TaxID=587636 RepID=A0A1H9VNT1_9MICO|nr:hypothetical protein [Pedococcus cremeus]SES23238.1 hypothetical protein SAMN05216199_2462 [Pedococcus cremeus]